MCITPSGSILVLSMCLLSNLNWLPFKMEDVDFECGLVVRGHSTFFAEELLHGWIETGAIILKHSQWVAITPLKQALPPSIVGTLRQRFTRLSAGCIDDLR